MVPLQRSIRMRTAIMRALWVAQVSKGEASALPDYIAAANRKNDSLTVCRANRARVDHAQSAGDLETRIERAVAELLAAYPESPGWIDGAVATLEALVSACYASRTKP
jgi:hypothetical protein